MIIKDERKEAFNKKLPCTTCPYNNICKYAGEVQPVEIPEIFDVIFVCKEKKKIEEPHTKEIENA